MSAPDIKEVVKERYGAAARRVTTGEASSCCGASASCGAEIDPITRDLYDASQTSILPEEAVKASMGCGNPTALAELKPGETVLEFWALAAGLMCCSQRGGLVLPAKPLAWI